MDDEVSFWIKHKGVDTLLLALTDGDLFWDQSLSDFRRPVGVPLPPALEIAFQNEPKWVDLRSYRDVADKGDTRFIEYASNFGATIHGIPKEDLLSEEVRQQRRSLMLAWSAAGSLLVLVALAYWQWEIAVEQRGIANKSEARAVEGRTKALLSQSRYLTGIAAQEMNRGNVTKALLLSLEALPDVRARVDRPYTPEMQRVLFDAHQRLSEQVLLKGHEQSVFSAVFSPDGRRVVTTSADFTARLWDSGERERDLGAQGA